MAPWDGLEPSTKGLRNDLGRGGIRESLDHPQYRSEIPWSKSYNYRNSMNLVGPEGLEPSTKGL